MMDGTKNARTQGTKITARFWRGRIREGLLALGGMAAMLNGGLFGSSDALDSWLSPPALCFAADSTDGKVFTEQPAVVPSVVRGASADSQPEKPAEKPVPKATAAKGPTPFWIWGPNPDGRYKLSTTFSGPFKSARLEATCDNVVTILVNGQRAGASDSWETPLKIDLQKYLKAEGVNELVAEVANSGGPSGFVARLTLVKPDDSVTVLVSDESWKAVATDKPDQAVAIKKIAKYGSTPWNDALSGAPVTAASNQFELLPGFQVERLFTVPRETLGSWVAIAFDHKGRIIASDQGDKGLCRITPPAPGSSEPTKVERLNVKITGAQGLLYAFDSLFVSINGGPGSGFYRCRDTNGDDQFDEVVKLKEFRGGGEHGPHALRLSPDGKSIFVICGNHTLPPFDPQETGKSGNSSRIPTNWSEDHILPRQWDANGHARGILAPGGWIARTDPDGKSWEVFSIGYRNPYDMDFNAEGELFAYDADMEWDLGSPWYRPTRVSHATSGSEFGWRSGTGKWPATYVDSLPALVDIGPGSPVGVAFGYGTKFPAKYQRALYICDWTFGTMYAIHLEPDGSTYRGVKEEFLSRSPLPLTDVAVGPDGLLYFSTGGRGTQSDLYRVRYAGQESTAAADPRDTKFADLRALRRKIEGFQAKQSDGAAAVQFLVPHLAHSDRFIRYAARVALEFQDLSLWQDAVLQSKNPETIITGIVGLARQGKADLQPKLVSALQKLNYADLTDSQKLEFLRAYQLVFIRLGEPEETLRTAVLTQLDAHFPAKQDGENRELANLLVYLRSKTIATKLIAAMEQPSKQDAADMTDLLSRNRGYGSTIATMLANQPDAQQMHYAFALRNLKENWTIDQRIAYFRWFSKAQKWSGGASYQGFLRNMESDAYDNANDRERLAVEAAGVRKAYVAPALPKPQGPGKDWTVAELVSLAEKGLTKRDFKNGERTYAATKCVVCHRFGGSGGATGPDLTQLAGRFTVKDLCESMIEPSKVVSDQYRAMVIETKDGRSYSGRIVSETTEAYTLLTNPEDATNVARVKKSDVESLMPSTVSLMPAGLLKVLNENEVLDLLAYLLSRGNPNDPMFRK
jgi:putative heme-binding domain-containing protein